METIFKNIYDKNLWKSSESISGPGSHINRTTELRTGLLKLIEKYNITSIIDCPCGDLNWISPIIHKLPNYTGIDIVDDLIKKNIKKYPKLNLIVDNMITSKLLYCDLLIVRDALFHFSQENIMKTINNIKKNNPKYLLTTELKDISHKNKNIRTGTWYPLALQNEPYNFPKPILSIKEDSKNKFISLWEVKDLPYFKVHTV